MNAKNKTFQQGLQFVPICLILIYKFIIQATDISHAVKLMILYGFIGISTLVFGYLIFSKK